MHGYTIRASITVDDPLREMGARNIVGSGGGIPTEEVSTWT